MNLRLKVATTFGDAKRRKVMNQRFNLPVACSSSTEGRRWWYTRPKVALRSNHQKMLVTWPSGKARDCKSFIPSSNLGVTFGHKNTAFLVKKLNFMAVNFSWSASKATFSDRSAIFDSSRREA